MPLILANHVYGCIRLIFKPQIPVVLLVVVLEHVTSIHQSCNALLTALSEYLNLFAQMCNLQIFLLLKLYSKCQVVLDTYSYLLCSKLYSKLCQLHAYLQNHVVHNWTNRSIHKKPMYNKTTLKLQYFVLWLFLFSKGLLHYTNNSQVMAIVCVMFKRYYTINLSSLISTLYVVIQGNFRGNGLSYLWLMKMTLQISAPWSLCSYYNLFDQRLLFIFSINWSSCCYQDTRS